MGTEKLRAEAMRLFKIAVGAADPAAALDRQFQAHPINPPKGTLFIIALGKAACPMMETALRHAPRVATRALVVTNPENAREIDGAELIIGGHPVPDAGSARAGHAVLDLLAQTTADDSVIALISGGGSALMVAPRSGLSLADKAEMSDLLLGAGLDITQMNHIRQQLSELKGGGLTRHAAPAPVEAFILSDVVGDDLRAVASGPTTQAIGTSATARELLETKALWEQTPAQVRSALSRPPDAASRIEAKNTLLCSNRQSLEAMNEMSELPARIINDRLEGDVAEAAQQIVQAAASAVGPCALIFGGETTVELTGTGLGGRNQELALRVALLLDDLPGDWVFLSGGTDGRDGPTDAAGGLVDPQSTTRIRDAGIDPATYLANNDSYAALKAAGDLLRTGGTGTNVADVQVFLKG